MSRRSSILMFVLQVILVGQALARDIPAWNVIPADYQNSANLTAILDIDHIASSDPNDILGAFVGEACRGVVSPVALGDDQLFFLTMYSNLNAEEMVLKAYIADLDTVIIVDEMISFIPGAEFGTPTEPYELNAIVFFDHNPIVTGIADQIIEIGSSFSTFDLDDFLIELDGDTIVWNAASTSNLTISLDTANVATITPVNDEWVGTDTLYFIATDQTDSAFTGQDTVHFTILPVDHPPELTEIPDQTIGSGGSFLPIDLDDFLIEQDGDSTSWSLMFESPATTDPDPTWSIDPADYGLSMTLTAVVDNRSAQILSDNYQLAVFSDDVCRGLVAPVAVVDQMMFFLTIYANTDGEDLEFRLWDGEEHLNLPILESVIFHSGTVIGGPESPFAMHAGYLRATLNAGHQVELTAIDPEWFGTENIRFYVQDEATLNSYTDSVSATFTVLQDHTPLVVGIADQVVETGTAFTEFDLDDYLTELDGDAVNWTVSGNTALNISIDGENLVSISPVLDDWIGAENLIFTVTDDNANHFSSSDSAVFTILPLDHAPLLGDIPDQTIGSGGTFIPIGLNDYLTELDGQSVQWSYNFSNPVETDPEPSWSVNPADYESDMTLTGEILNRGNEINNANVSLAVFVGDECRGVTNPIQALDTWMFFLTIYANESGESLKFRLYDADAALNLPVLEALTFEPASSVGSPESPYQLNAGFLQVAIDSSDLVAINTLDPLWFGSEDIWFVAQDEETENHYADSTSVTFTILEDHTPLVSGLQDQSIEQGAAFTPFDLDDFLTEIDGEDVEWSVEGSADFSVDIDLNNSVTITRVDEEWLGSGFLIFTVTDLTSNALSSSDTILVTVNPLDHPPVIATLPSDTIGIGGDFLTLDLSLYLEEVDGDEIVWSFDHAMALDPVPSPQWSVNPAEFEYNMSVTTQVNLRNTSSSSPQNILAAFAGDDCHGVAVPQMVGEDALYFLTIYGNTNGEELEFRIYDALRMDTLIIHQSHIFQSNAVIGSPDTPESFTAQNLELSIINEHELQIVHTSPVWTGTEAVDIIARDMNTDHAYSDSALTYFTVLPEMSPSFQIIANQEILEGASFSTIVLDDYLEFLEPEDVSWFVSGEESLQVSINTSHELSVLTPHADWFGSENLSLELQRNDNPSLNAYQNIQFSVLPVNDPPVVSSQTVSLDEDSFIEIYLEASDIEFDELSLDLTQGPIHGSFEGDIYTPNLNYYGSDSLKYTAFDGQLYSDTAAVYFTIDPVNDLPEFTSIPQLLVQQDAIYQYQLTAQDIENDSLIFDAVELPDWLSYNGLDLLSGAPANADVGIHPVRISLADTAQVDSLVWQEFAITVENVNDAPFFTSSNTDTTRQDMLFEYLMTATDIDGDTLSFLVENLPDWLSFNTGNMLSGTPENADVGEYQVTLIVLDPQMASDTLELELFVSNVNDPPAFTSQPSLQAEQDLLYQYQMTASDVDGDSLTFAATVLPGWLEFDGIDRLQGTPANENVGQHQVEISVSDPWTLATPVIQNFTITVGNVNDAPEFTSTVLDTATQDIVYEYMLEAIDLDGDSLIFTVGTLPEWLQFTAPALLSGTPGNADVGTSAIDLYVSDPNSATDTLHLQITVQNVNDPPVALAGADGEYLSEATISLDGSESYDLDLDTLSYYWDIPPSMILLGSLNARITLQLPEVSESIAYPVGLQVFDGELYSHWDTLIVQVNAISEVTSTDFSTTPQAVGEPLYLEITFPEYYVPIAAKLYFQSGGSTRLDSVDMKHVSRSQVWSAEIPAGSVSETGLSYYAEAVDSQGNAVTINARSVPVTISAGSASMSTTANSAFPGGVPAGKWRLTSIPTLQDQSETSILFNAVLGDDESDLTWRLFEWDGVNWQSPDSLISGRGYWFQHRLEEAVDIILGNGRSADLTGTTLVIQPGWNLVSSPYNFPILHAIDSTKFSGPYTYGDFNGEGWELASDTLKPWAAYALYNWSDSLENLSLDPHGTASSMAKPSAIEDGWRILASAGNGSFSDQDNTIGRSSSASSARDEYDRAEPPAWEDYLSLYIENQNLDQRVKTFAYDIRSQTENVEQWSLQLAAGQRTNGVELKFVSEGSLPSGHVNILVDIQQHSWIELNADHQIGGLSLNSNYNLKYMIFSGPRDQVYQAVEELLSALPDRNSLAANYPNPFNGGTNIRFSVRDPAMVQLDIYDIRGRLVQTLVNRVRDRGHYIVNWNGLNNNMLPVSSGIYIYRLTVDPVNDGQFYQSARKMVIVR